MAHFYGRHISAATQWDLVQAAAKTLASAHEELLRQAAQAPVLYNDDTTMKVLQLTKAQRAAVLARRSADLPAPIQMCDGVLSRNIPSDFDTVLSQCITHARRKYVELTETFPAEVRFVLETLREVYITDARARNEGLNPDQRLLLHQDESAPRMVALEHWMKTQFAERKIEPNSARRSSI